MSQLHDFLCWRYYFEIFNWLQFSPCALMAHHFRVWHNGSSWGMSCCPVIKYMDKEPHFSLCMCPGRARALGGDLEQWPPSCICTEPQSPPRFSNGPCAPHPPENLSLWVPYFHPSQGALVPHADSSGLLCLFPDRWPCCHSRRDLGGFLCVQLGASWSARTTNY